MPAPQEKFLIVGWASCPSWKWCNISVTPFNQTRLHYSKTAMNFLRRRINPGTFVITRRQLAKYLKTHPSRVWRWEKWKHVLWVHIEGIGGYFISYRQLEQWIAACCTLIRSCRDLKTLAVVWSAIKREAERYTEDAIARLSEIHKQRLAQLSRSLVDEEF